jgi:hypothetical protein
MAALAQLDPITANGTYTLSNLRPGEEYAIGVSGIVGTAAAFGSGSLAINWRSGTATGAYPDSPLTAEGGFVVVALGTEIDFILTGATSPSFRITVATLIK